MSNVACYWVGLDSVCFVPLSITNNFVYIIIWATFSNIEYC